MIHEERKKERIDAMSCGAFKTRSTHQTMQSTQISIRKNSLVYSNNNLLQKRFKMEYNLALIAC